MYSEYTIQVEKLSPVINFVLLSIFFILRYIVAKRKNQILFNIIICLLFAHSSYAVLHSWLFDNLTYNLALSLNFAIFVCSISYLFVFNNISLKNRNYHVYVSSVLSSIFFGLFVYFLCVEPTLNPLPAEFAISIALDSAILSFYIILGLYRNSFKKMWEIGVYVFILIPIINFVAIFRLLGFIDITTDSINLFQQNIASGSTIIAIIICSLMYLPVILNKLKAHIDSDPR
jgi:hypothetical protein